MEYGRRTLYLDLFESKIFFSCWRQYTFMGANVESLVDAGIILMLKVKDNDPYINLYGTSCTCNSGDCQALSIAYVRGSKNAPY